MRIKSREEIMASISREEHSEVVMPQNLEEVAEEEDVVVDEIRRI